MLLSQEARAATLFFLPHGGIEQPCDFQNLPRLDKNLMLSQARTKGLFDVDKWIVFNMKAFFSIYNLAFQLYGPFSKQTSFFNLLHIDNIRTDYIGIYWIAV